MKMEIIIELKNIVLKIIQQRMMRLLQLEKSWVQEKNFYIIM
jgi:uncharacterized protein YjbK